MGETGAMGRAAVPISSRNREGQEQAVAFPTTKRIHVHVQRPVLQQLCLQLQNLMQTGPRAARAPRNDSMRRRQQTGWPHVTSLSSTSMRSRSCQERKETSKITLT